MTIALNLDGLETSGKNEHNESIVLRILRNKNSDERKYSKKGVRLIAESLSNFSFFSTVSALIVDFGKRLFVTVNLMALILFFFSFANRPKKFAN